MGNTEIFEAMADGYDTPERVRIAEIASNAIREYIEEDGRDKRAIDFGCGTGLVGLHLLDAFRHVLFLDTSQKMLDRISDKLAGANIRNADTMCFDIEAGFSPELRADYVFMAQVLLHIRDIELVLSRLYDVLNPGGHLVIVDFVKNENVQSDKVHNGFEPGELSDVMAGIGFKDMQFKTIYSGSKIFMNQDASMFILDSRK